MALDSTVLRTRRSILVAVAGAAAAVVMPVIGRVAPVDAANGDAVKVGQSFAGTAATTIRNSSSTGDGIVGRSSSATGAGIHGTNSAGGDAVLATGATGVGVHAVVSNGVGVRAELSGVGAAILAQSLTSSPAVEAINFGTGAALIASTAVGSAITAFAGGSEPSVLAEGGQGPGVTGQTKGVSAPTVRAGVIGASDTHYGGYFKSDSGTALKVLGRVSFTHGGRFRIAAGVIGETFSLSGVRPSSYVLATLQTNHSGLWIQAVVPGTDSFEVHLNKSVATDIVIGCLVVN